jgi:predicted PurR-regulated permease PerM
VRTLEDKTFMLLLIAVTLAFAWIVWQFYGAVLWGIVAAIVFAPVYRWLLKTMRRGRTVAAFATAAIIVVIVILPLALINGFVIGPLIAAMFITVWHIFAASRSRMK